MINHNADKATWETSETAKTLLIYLEKGSNKPASTVRIAPTVAPPTIPAANNPAK